VVRAADYIHDTCQPDLWAEQQPDRQHCQASKGLSAEAAHTTVIRHCVVLIADVSDCAYLARVSAVDCLQFHCFQVAAVGRRA
jgi:hypothetical protein